MEPYTIQRPQGFLEARRMVSVAVCSIFSSAAMIWWGRRLWR